MKGEKLKKNVLVVKNIDKARKRKIKTAQTKSFDDWNVRNKNPSIYM